MNVFSRWRRSATALGVAAVALPVAIAAVPASASAAPVRTAITTKYTDTTFLQDALGLPTSDTSPAIESVTYDRLQWLLQQSGNLAFLIGDPAEDTSFAARARDVEAAAEAAGVKKVYWFDPNLSGNAVVGSGRNAVTEPNLDIRNPAGITSLGTSGEATLTASQTTYGNAWLNLVGQYLGDGVTATPTKVGTENAQVTATTGTTTVNDYGLTAGYSTEIASGSPNTNGGALYDYTSTTPANVSHSYFFIYNKNNTVSVSGTPEPAKIVSWIDLDGETSSALTQTDVSAAIDTVGASNLTELDQFAWWESEVNSKENIQASSNADGGNVPVLGDSDNSAVNGGWKIDQITYPELVDLLKTSTSANAVIFFGGTWCPNTRPVLPFVNKYAQQNNVTVYNFDTVLDGGTVGGSSTTSPGNPLQSRNSAANGTVTNANPTFLYGDLISTYLKNIQTEYSPTAGGGSVTYFPGGNTASALTTVNKLQVPFVIGYQNGSSLNTDAAGGGGVTRQWIQQDSDVSGLPFYTEYMSDWWFTNPQPNELGITKIPLDAPIWSTINSELSDLTWQTSAASLDPSVTSDTDDAQYLDSADKATVTYTAPSTVTVASSASGSVGISPAALSAALSTLGDSAPANLAAAKTALIAAEAASPQNPTLIANLDTIVGAWGVAQQRKTTLINAWGTSTSPGSVLGAASAIHALDIFFGGLPGGVVSTQTLTANSVDANTSPTINVAIANEYGRNPTGNVTLTVQDDAGDTVATGSDSVDQGQASFTLPVLDAGTYNYTVSYAGDSQILSFNDAGSLTVTPVVPSGGGDTTTTPTTVTNVVTVTTPGPTVTTPGPTVTVPVNSTPPVVTAARIKVKRILGAVAQAPTTKKAGKYKVEITAPSGKSDATGEVTIRLKNGKTTKSMTGKLSHGAVTFSVPKLAAGSWKVAIVWQGDANYLAGSTTGASIKVKSVVTEESKKATGKKTTAKKKK